MLRFSGVKLLRSKTGNSPAVTNILWCSMRQLLPNGSLCGAVMSPLSRGWLDVRSSCIRRIFSSVITDAVWTRRFALIVKMPLDAVAEYSPPAMSSKVWGSRFW